MVSARKQKAKLNKAKRAELKSRNTDVLNHKEMQDLGDELLRSIVDGFSAELEKSSPGIKKLAKSNEALIQEFFLGVKDGIKEEIESAVADGMKITKNLAEAPDSSEVMDQVLEFLKKNNTSTDKLTKSILKKEKEEAKKNTDPTSVTNNNTTNNSNSNSSNSNTNNSNSNSSNSNTNNSNSNSSNSNTTNTDVKPNQVLNEKEKTSIIKSFKETLQGLFKEHTKVITVLTKEELESAREVRDQLIERTDSFESEENQQAFTTGDKIKHFGHSLIGNLFGVEDEDNKVLKQKKARDAFINNEMKLNPGAKRKDLEESWKTLNTEKEKLQTLEKERSSLEKQGYSKEEINTLINHDTRLKESTEKVKAADPAEQRKAKEELENPKEKKKVNPLTDQEYTEPLVDPAKQEVPAVRTPQNISGSEEAAAEAKDERKEALEVHKDALTVLKEIRDILNKPGSGNKDEAKGEQNESGGGSSLLDTATDLLGNGKAKPGGKAPAGKLGKIGGMLKGAAIGGAVLSVAGGAYEGYTSYQEAQGKTDVATAEVKQLEETGAITKEEAATKLKEVDDTDRENKFGAVGRGLGTALGGIGGMIAGQALMPGVGTVAGGTLGAMSGAEVGQNIGGAIGIGYNKIQDFLGFGSPSVKDQPGAGTSPITSPVQLTATPGTNVMTLNDIKNEAVTGGNTANASSSIMSSLQNTAQVVGGVAAAGVLGTALRGGQMLASAAGVPSVLASTDVKVPTKVQQNLFSNPEEDAISKLTAKVAETGASGGGGASVIPIPTPPQQTSVVDRPFYNNVRNNEVQLTDYLRSRYST